MIDVDNKLIDLNLLKVFHAEFLSEIKELLYPRVTEISFNEETGDIEATLENNEVS